MTIIAVFIIFCAFALYLSSLSSLHSLQELKISNDLLNLNAQLIESLNTEEKNIDKLSFRSNIAEIRYSFLANQKVTSNLIYQSLLLCKTRPQIKRLLNEANATLIQLKNAQALILGRISSRPLKMTPAEVEIWNADLLVTKQLLLDTNEILINAQINIKTNSDNVFDKLYANRFKPLAVGVSVLILFFSFVIVFGLSLSRRIGVSVSQLLDATDRVGHGDLNYEVQVLEHDEIGRLSFAFNKMITSLRNGQNQLSLAIDRTTRLQTITASFSEALTLDQVFDVIFKQAFESLGAVAASIALLSEDKNFLELKRLEGYDQDVFLKWKRFPVTMDTPSAKVVRFGQPLFLTAGNLTSEYKSISDSDKNPLTNSIACLPLIIGSESLGALTFSFTDKKSFENTEKDFMLALARQCAQAIHRSLLYDDAKKAIEVRDEFLSIASHELRTPLTPLKLQIQGVARQIKNGNIDALTPERLIKMVETSDQQITRLSTLINDLLDVSRITSGKLVLRKTRFGLREMLEEVIAQYAIAMRESQTSVELNVKEDSFGEWDRVRLEQVIINLLTNAAKYAPKKTIHITLSKTEDTSKIEVRDEGPGIARNNWERIFNRFERVTSKENVGGLGLGLYISKQIVEAHRGTIFVKSVLGSGSIFTVELPEGREV
jgi:signal transduction histidine kinase/HAMP domain-containing protein